MDSVQNRQFDLDKPLVSVIMPTYNVKKYFEKSIMSVRNQTLKEIEIILVDDGSTDGTYEMCQNQAERDSRIIVLSNGKNRGVAYSRNRGLEVARGSYIAFLDSDDWVEADMLEYLQQILIENKADISTCGICLEYLDGRSKKKGSHKLYCEEGHKVLKKINLSKDFTPFIVDKLYTRRVLGELRFPEKVSVGEDYYLLSQILMNNPSVVHGGKCKYHYQQLHGSVTHKGFENKENTEYNRNFQKQAFEMQEDMNDGDSALAYYMLQEMSVPISMVKSGKYDEDLIQKVQREVRRYLNRYMKVKEVPVYLKICALCLSIHKQLLFVPYRLCAFIGRLM